ncbi:MAG: glycosyltransferase [Ilumatobacteraceae bacterium]
MDVAILAAARFPISEPFAGGMEMHTHLLADNLARRGHDVTVYAAGGSGRFHVRPMLPMDFEASVTARRDVSAGANDGMAEHHSYLEAMVALASSGHDVVHLNAVHHLPFACAGLLDAVVTATLHCPPTPWLESALQIAARTARPPHLASVSRTNAAAWRPTAIDRVIGNGVDLTTWLPGPGGDAAVWMGRLVPEKAPHLAIDACRAAGRELRLLGPVHDIGYFRAEVQPRLGADATYLGHANVGEVAAVVAESAVAVVTPVWDEPFGLVVIEAMASGTPVAALARGALAELVDDEVGALADDPASLASVIEVAATRDRSACRRRAERAFSADVMVDAYETWFAELLAS